MSQRLLRLIASPWFIAAVALLLRGVYFLHQAALIPHSVLAYVPFENEAGNIAQALANGDGFCCLFRQPTGPTAWLVPVYPALLALIFKLFGTFTFASFCVAASLNCLFSALATLPVFAAARRIAGLLPAVLAAWLWAFTPAGIRLPFEWIWDTSLSALLSAALLWATLRLADSPTLRAFLAYGLLWGFSILSNPSLGAALPFFLAWLLVRLHRRGALRLAPLAASLALIFAICLPWTVRNAVQFHRLIPMRSNLPFELWIGNNEIYDPDSRAINRITRFEQIRLYAQLGETQFLDDKREAALRFIRSHPALTAQLCWRRVVSTWIGTPAPWRDFLQADAPIVRIFLSWNALTLLGLLLALARLLRARSPFFLPLLAFPLAFPLVYYLTQTSLRLRHPLDPILALSLALAVLPWHPPLDLPPQAAKLKI